MTHECRHTSCTQSRNFCEILRPLSWIMSTRFRRVRMSLVRLIIIKNVRHSRERWRNASERQRDRDRSDTFDNFISQCYSVMCNCTGTKIGILSRNCNCIEIIKKNYDRELSNEILLKYRWDKNIIMHVSVIILSWWIWLPIQQKYIQDTS